MPKVMSPTLAHVQAAIETLVPASPLSQQGYFSSDQVRAACVRKFKQTVSGVVVSAVLRANYTQCEAYPGFFLVKPPKV